MSAVPGLPPSIRACLFDLDGVLTATNELHRRAWARAFDAYLLGRGERPFDPGSDFDRYVNGRARTDGVRALLSARGLRAGDRLVAELAAQKNDELLRLLRAQGVRPYPGAVRFVTAVRDAGLRTAVVSSSANAKAVLEAASIEQLFDARIDGVVVEERHLRGKPAPDAFLAGAQAVGVEPTAAAVFEDALAGVEAGRAGGFGLVVGVDSGGHAAELREHGAGRVVTDLAELLA
jgi:beta-phosphoglucomutase family hydrolase